MSLPGPSLKGRALKLLSQREHSRLELQRKLARHADDEHTLQAVLEELQQLGWLSDERFAESLVHRKAAKMGLSRLRQELSLLGVDGETATQALAGLKDSEPERALEVWRKRFSAPPADAMERAKQIRFLMSRGFSTDAIQRALKQATAAPGD